MRAEPALCAVNWMIALRRAGKATLAAGAVTVTTAGVSLRTNRSGFSIFCRITLTFAVSPVPALESKAIGSTGACSAVA